MALTTLQSIQAEIRQLEERKKLVEKRDNDVPKALAILQTYAQVLTPAQRRQVARIMGDTVDQAAAPRAAKKAKRKSGGKVAAKYQLPSGDTWTGRGRTSTAFQAWANSAEGKAWRKANPGQQFPAAAGSMAANKPVKKAGKKAAKAAKAAKNAPARKRAAKKAVKKITRKAAKKA